MSAAPSHHRVSLGLGEAPRGCPTRSRLIGSRDRAQHSAASLSAPVAEAAPAATGWWAFCAVARAEAGTSGARA